MKNWFIFKFSPIILLLFYLTVNYHTSFSNTRLEELEVILKLLHTQNSVLPKND